MGIEDTDDDPSDGGFTKVNWEELVANKQGEGTDGRTFWIRETKAPEGYEANPAIIQVYVGEQTIYANASAYKVEKQEDGSYKAVLIDDYSSYYTSNENDKEKLENLQSGTQFSTDGVSVRSSIGKLFQSMAKYADMIVDSTLVDITARDYIFVNTEDGHTQLPEDANKPNWSFAGTDGVDDGHNFNLHYWGDKLSIFSSDYGTDHQNPVRSTGTYASTNNGFMYLRPTQTPNDEEKASTATDNPFSYDTNHPGYQFSTRRTTLREKDGSATDISDLFSPSTVIVVEDVKTGTLTVEKEIENADPDPTAEFNFNVELTPPEGKVNLQKDLLKAKRTTNGGETAEETLEWTEVKDAEGNVTGLKATFKLKHGEQVKISGIIYGTTYTVTEAENDNYTLLNVKKENAEGAKESVEFDKDSRSVSGIIGDEIDGETAEAVVYLLFCNTKPLELPFTGGSGVAVFYVIGTALLLASGAAWIGLYKKRKSA